MIRQGDLLFVFSSIPVPQDAKLDTSGIIARGVATGHTHAIRPKSKAELYFSKDVAHIRVKEDTAVDHQEHKTVFLPPGEYLVKRQREYQPDGWKQVLD